MLGKYEDNPIYELTRHMIHELNWNKKFKNKYSITQHYEKLDDILKFILLNNGCKISEDESILQYQAVYSVIPNEYDLYFVYGMMGNDANEYYDFLIFNGMKVLVIFVDYFDDILTGPVDENEELYYLKTEMGNSIYYEAIKKIVEIFYSTSEPMSGRLLTTAMTTIQRWNSSIIAIHILNGFKPVDGNDVSDIPMEDINKILEGNIQLQLYGIRTMQ